MIRLDAVRSAVNSTALHCQHESLCVNVKFECLLFRWSRHLFIPSFDFAHLNLFDLWNIRKRKSMIGKRSVIIASHKLPLKIEGRCSVLTSKGKPEFHLAAFTLVAEVLNASLFSVELTIFKWSDPEIQVLLTGQFPSPEQVTAGWVCLRGAFAEEKEPLSFFGNMHSPPSAPPQVIRKWVPARWW